MWETFPDPPGSALTNLVFYPPGRQITHGFGKAAFCGREAAASVFISLSFSAGIQNGWERTRPGLPLVLVGAWTVLCGKKGGVRGIAMSQQDVCQKDSSGQNVVSREWSEAGDVFLEGKKRVWGTEGIYKQNETATERVNAERSKRDC